MNTLPLPPAWYWPASRRGSRGCRRARYPEATYRPLREAIGALRRLHRRRRSSPGAGCDEILLLVRALGAGPGRPALVAAPTYQMYAVATRDGGAARGARAARRPGARLRRAPRRAPGARLVVHLLAQQPDRRGGGARSWPSLRRRARGLVVVDQAYLEFGGDDLSDLIAEHDNLVIRRTLSKGFGAGLARVGYALAAPPIAGALDALRPPGSISLAVGGGRPSWRSRTPTRCAPTSPRTSPSAAACAAALEALGIEVLAEAGHVRDLPAAARLRRGVPALGERGCVMRTFGHEPLLQGVIRATVQTPPRTTGCSPRWPSSLERDARRRPVPAEHDRLGAALDRRSGPRARPRSTAGWSSTAPAGARSRPASASSTTC